MASENPNLERGIAYNPTTNNVLLLSRFGNPDTVKGLRILDGTTGLDKGFVDFNTTNVTGGTFYSQHDWRGRRWCDLHGQPHHQRYQ